MRTHLLAYAAYKPAYRLHRTAIADALDMEQAANGYRSVAGFDEDAITMAVASLRRLAERAPRSGSLYFATSSPPFMDKTNATLVQAAAGGPEFELAVDLAGLSSGFAALACAHVSGGTATLSDLHSGRPGSDAESEGGDGAAAFVFGQGHHPVAEVVATASRASAFMDVWRSPGEAAANVAEQRLVASVHRPLIDEVVTEVMDAAGLGERPARTVVASPNRRLAATVADRWGHDTRVQRQHRERAGYCGAADVGLLLTAALDVSHEHETVLAISAAGTVDAMLMRALRDGPLCRTPLDDNGKQSHAITYPQFLTWKGWLEREGNRRPEPTRPSIAASHRNRDWKLRLMASRCQACDAVWLPPQRVCGACHRHDAMEPHEMAGRPARLAALSTDNLTDNPMPPAVSGVVDFEGGGRMSAEITDRTSRGPRVGDPVEMVFRRTCLSQRDPDYFWKARTLQEG